jgi:hypothetical protein
VPRHSWGKPGLEGQGHLGPPLRRGPWHRRLNPTCSPQDPVAPEDGLSPLQVCVPWEENIAFPAGEEMEQEV